MKNYGILIKKKVCMILQIPTIFKPFIYHIEKMAKHTLKILWCSHTRFLKCVWPFFNIIYVKALTPTIICCAFF